jgi:hypothetical protein
MFKLKIYIFSLSLFLSTQTLQAKVSSWLLPLALIISFANASEAHSMSFFRTPQQISGDLCDSISTQEEQRALLGENLFAIGNSRKYRGTLTRLVREGILTPESTPESVAAQTDIIMLSAAIIQFCGNLYPDYLFGSQRKPENVKHKIYIAGVLVDAFSQKLEGIPVLPHGPGYF